MMVGRQCDADVAALLGEVVGQNAGTRNSRWLVVVMQELCNRMEDFVMELQARGGAVWDVGSEECAAGLERFQGKSCWKMHAYGMHGYLRHIARVVAPELGVRAVQVESIVHSRLVSTVRSLQTLTANQKVAPYFVHVVLPLANALYAEYTAKRGKRTLLLSASAPAPAVQRGNDLVHQMRLPDAQPMDADELDSSLDFVTEDLFSDCDTLALF